MRKIFAVLTPILILILPAVAWSACCLGITAGPTAWAPEFSKTGCSGVYKKGSYGGTTTFRPSASTVDHSTASVKAALCIHQGANPSVASRGTSVPVSCDVTGSIAGLWATTPTCVVLKGPYYFTEYSATIFDCGAGVSVTTKVASEDVQSL